MTHVPFTATEEVGSLRLPALALALCVLLGLPAGTLGEAPEPWLLRVTPSSADAAIHCNQSGVVAALPVDEGGDPVQLPFAPGRALMLDLDPRREWRLSIDVPGCWAPEATLDPTASRSEHDVLLWRAGAVAGHLVLERHEQAPEALEVRLTPVLGEMDTERPPIVSIVCPVQDMRFTCRLPAERFDLRIAAEDFIPVYRWDVMVAPGATRDLGDISLERGASLSGWIVTESSLSDRPQVQVVPEVVGGTGTRTGERLSQRALSVETTERGFFHVRGIAPGSYRVLAQAPGHGTAERAPVIIEERCEHVLEEPLVLEPFAEVAVSVDPPVGPALHPWTIRLRRQIPLSSMYRQVAEDRVDENGFWSRADLESGHYLVEVLDSEGSSHFQQELEANSTTRPLDVVLSLVPIRGRLRAAEQPLSRTLWFERMEGGHIRMISDENGEFQGVLPDEGSWKVRIAPSRGKGQRWLKEEVVVARPRGEAWAKVDIELPATHLVGEVLDADRRRVPGALVSVYDSDQPLAQVYTRDDGSFKIHGLPSGEISVRAEAEGNRESALTPVELGADDSSSVELIVREQRALRGRVVLNGRAFAGARIHYRVPRTPIAGSLYADPEGAFTLWLPAWVESVDVVVLAPGLPTKLTRIQVPTPGADLSPLVLEPIAGDLAVRLPSNGQPLYIRRDGSFVPIWSLFLPMDGGTLRGLDGSTGILHLPLEPGIYTVCPSPEESRRCESGYLAPAGQLMLNLRSVASRDSDNREGKGI
jgi:hypothetical protein